MLHNSQKMPGFSIWDAIRRGQGVFSVYRANGKQIQVIHARIFVAEEEFFYERQQEKTLSQGGLG